MAMTTHIPAVRTRSIKLVHSARRGTDRSVEHEIFDMGRRRGETALFYDPPYESELDDKLARHFVAYLAPTATLEYRAEIWALYSRCRVDFLIDTGTRRIAFDYSETPEDLSAGLVEDNDALMLGSEKIDVVYRVRRVDLADRLFDVLHLISQWEPGLFTPYGRRTFAAAATSEARRSEPGPEHDLARIAYPSPPAQEEEFDDVFTWPEPVDDHLELVVRRLSRDNPDPWQRHYERARVVYGLERHRLDLQPV